MNNLKSICYAYFHSITQYESFSGVTHQPEGSFHYDKEKWLMHKPEPLV
jgi:hypothetical protein